MNLNSPDEFDLSWPAFRQILEEANEEKISRLPQLEGLQTAKSLQIYSYGVKSRELVSQLRNIGIACLIFDNNPIVRERAVADGYSVIEIFDPKIPIIVAAGQNQIEIMDSLIQESLGENAYYLMEAVYALNLNNQLGKAKYFSDIVNIYPERFYTIFRCLTPSSRVSFLEVMQYRASLNVRYLRSRRPMVKMWDPPVANLSVQSFCDVGAYDGDSLEAIKRLYPKLSKSYTIEPNNDLASAIATVSKRLGIDNTNFVGACWSHAARLAELWAIDGMFSVYESENGNIAADSLDNLLSEDIYDYIKMDVEGTEIKVILGGIKSLNNAICIAVASYHLPDDIISLTTQLHMLLKNDENNKWDIHFTHNSQSFDDSIFFFVKSKH